MDLLTLVYAIFGIGFLIFVHELGHFLAAKRVGIRVETFALGFQPTIFGFKARFCAFKWGDTEYVIGMLPFGGYVKMSGEEPGDERTGSPDEYASKKPSERAQVLVAGAIMNLIFGFIFFIIAYSVGVPADRSRVGAVSPGEPAWSAGIRPHDLVTAVDGEPIREFRELFTEVALSSRDEPLALTIERNDKVIQLEVRPRFDAGRGILGIGVIPATTAVVEDVIEGLPAGLAGLKSGDLIEQLTFVTDRYEFTVPKSVSPSGWWRLISSYVTQDPGGRIRMSVRGADGASRELQFGSVENEEATKERQPVIGVLPSARMIGYIQPGSDAEKLLRLGQEVVQLGDTPIHQLGEWTVMEQPSGPVVLRMSDNETVTVDRDVLFGWLVDNTVFATGVMPSDKNGDEPPKTPAVIGNVGIGSPASKAGLRAGDRVTKVGETSVDTYNAFRVAITAQDSSTEIPFVIDRGGETLTIKIRPEKPRHIFGFSTEADKFIKQGGVVEACQLGLADMGLWMKRVFLTLNSLIKRDVSAKNLAGPVGIIMATKRMSTQGLGSFLWFLALISVNLGVFNLLPFPILDGGHLLFLAIEKIKGSPVNDSVMHYAHLVAFVLLISLALFVTFHDIKRWFLS